MPHLRGTLRATDVASLGLRTAVAMSVSRQKVPYASVTVD
jgi:hypothetical protein